MKKYSVFLLLTIFCLSPLHSQDSRENRIESNFQNTNVFFNYHFSNAFRAKVKGEDRKVDVLRQDFSIVGKHLDFAYGRRDFDWQSDSLHSNPFEKLEYLSLFVHDFLKVDDSWRILFRAGVTSGFEGQMDSSFSYFGLLGAHYRLNEIWSLVFGTAYRWSVPKKNLFPVAGLNYSSPSFIQSGKGLSASLGLPRTGVTYAFTRRFQSGLHMRWDSNVFRLSNDNNESPGGYVDMSDWILGADFGFAFSRRAKLKAGFDWDFIRDYVFYDEDGRRLYRRDINSASGFSVNLQIGF
jgi:hypothetical protein